MELSTFLTLFLIGFVLGLLSRIIYGMMTGRLQIKQNKQSIKPIDKVRYISPKLNKYTKPKPANKQQEPQEDKKAVNE